MAFLNQEIATVTLLYTAYATYIYNRKSVSFCLPALINDGISTETAGLIVSSQNTAYAISKLLGGIISDYASPRKLLALGLLSSGITTFLFARTDWEHGYAMLWFLNGLAQGFGWPACAKILQMASPKRFGMFWSILSTSANVAGILSPILSAFLIVLMGWRWNLHVVSGISIVVGFVCLVSVNDDGMASKKEAGCRDNTTTNETKSSLGALFKNPLLWLVSFYYFAVFCIKTALSDWCQVFLVAEYQLNKDIGSRFSSSMELGGFIGSLAIGYLTDYRIESKLKHHEYSGPLHTRMVCTSVCAAIQCACLHVFFFHTGTESSEVFLMLLGLIVGACLYGQIVMYGIMASTMVASNLSGTCHSIVALAANVGAVTAGFPLASLAGRNGWKYVFVLLEGVGAIVVITMLLCMNMFKVKAKQA